ncbi:hypothetical protein [uncultured Eubacterium sp.]|mgnify:FL=1|uniref:hypothetical protein n=1 Tax=uncultured Eubacterium sp. TaxID=165185 RepID=UPI0025E71796|nr:hypothetical protein [uncultured Eubacterium sp.]
MTKMKKVLAVGLAGLMAVGFAACSSSNDSGKNEDTNKDAVATAKTGYAISSEIKEDEYNKSETALEIDSVCAAVLVDADGKIIDVKIDEAQTKPDLKKDNGDVSDLRTKLEKKEDYGMKSTSPIGKEWYEQVEAFEAWAKGKTAEEVKAGIGEDGYASDADLKAGCTIYANGFATVTAKAVENATDCGAKATDTLKLGMTTSKYYESNETNLQYDTDYAIVTVDADGKVTSCIIDASQAKCTIADGKFTVEKGAFKSKKELGDDYAMKSASPIGKEWYEQAAAYEQWCIGKTADEIKGCYGEDMSASDADLKAGCTITISAIADNTAKAINS